MTERAHLREVQYRDDGNLNARIDLHRRFSVNPAVFSRWVFDQLDPPPDARVLEVGCGPGILWAANRDRVPPGWRVVLTDFSPGMLAAARARLGERYRLAVADAEALPHPDGAFDAVVANHMLYHVADRPQAIREMARVLRPDGVLLAVTNGPGHMREIDELVTAWAPEGALARASARFGLHNGAAQLGEAFAGVDLRRWEDRLEITEVEPLLAYVRSLLAGRDPDLDALRRRAADVIAREGAFRVTKATGLFVARSPIQSPR